MQFLVESLGGRRSSWSEAFSKKISSILEFFGKKWILLTRKEHFWVWGLCESFPRNLRYLTPKFQCLGALGTWGYPSLEAATWYYPLRSILRYVVYSRELES